MARCKNLPDVEMHLSDDFSDRLKEFSGGLVGFEEMIVDQIKIEIDAYWKEADRINKSRMERFSALQGKSELLQSTFIYFDPKIQQSMRMGRQLTYVYWREAKYGLFSDKSTNQRGRSNVKRRGNIMSPSRKATMTSSAAYEPDKFVLPPSAEWQRDLIQRYEDRFQVLRHCLKFSQSMIASLMVVTKAIGEPLTAYENTETNSEDDDIERLTKLAERLRELGDNPDELAADEVEFLFNASDGDLEVFGINPNIKKIYTGIRN